AFGGAAANGHALADGVVVADLGLGWLALILQILRRHADRGEGIDRVPRAQAGVAVHHHVRDEVAFLAENDIGTDGAVGADGAGFGDNRPGRHNRAGMNAHSVAVTDAAAAAIWSTSLSGADFAAGLPSAPARGTTAQVSTASQAILPSTYALPSMRPARVRKASTSISMRSLSPGVTGWRNLARSMPVKTTSFSWRSGNSCVMMMPPAWAMASITSTPGMMG